MPRMRTVAREAIMAGTRHQLLEAAATEFAREGYVGANINHISQAAGFAKGTIYNYFPSKRELMLALIDEIAAIHTEAVMQQVEPEQGPAQRLGCFFRAGYMFVEQHPAQARVIVNAVYGPDAAIRERVYQAYDRLLTMITQDILKTGVARGDFRALDSDLTTALIMTVYLGSCSQLDSKNKIWLDPDQVVEFILHGLCSRECRLNTA